MARDFWVDALSVGVDKFDNDHRHQLNSLGEIEDALELGDRPNAVLRLDQLIRHVAAHQVEELTLLERAGYPDIALLREQQVKDLGRLRSLMEQVESGMILDEARIMTRNMRMGFADCLLKGDIDFRPYLEKSGLNHH